MKNTQIALIALTLAFSQNVLADKCFIDAKIYAYPAPSYFQPRVYLDTVSVNVSTRLASDDSPVVTNEDAKRIQAAISEFRDKHINEILEYFPDFPKSSFQVSDQFRCHTSVSGAEHTRRAYGDYADGKTDRKWMKINGDWSKALTPVAKSAAEEKAAPVKSDSVKSRPDSSPTESDVNAAKQKTAAQSKQRTEDALNAGARKKAESDAQTKIAVDKQRQTCSAPENRSSCACQKFYPQSGSTTKACTK